MPHCSVQSQPGHLGHVFSPVKKDVKGIVSVSYAKVAQEPSLSSEAASVCGKCIFSIPRYSTNNLEKLIINGPCIDSSERSILIRTASHLTARKAK